MNRVIKHSLRRAASQLPCADFEYIADASIKRMSMHDSITRPQAAFVELRTLQKLAFSGLSVACLLLVSIWGWQNWMPYGIITLDVNPGFEITLNRRDIVLDIKGINEEAQSILEGQNYRGWEPAEAIGALCAGIATLGYMNDDNVILLSGYIPNHAAHTDALLDNIDDIISATNTGIYIYSIASEQSNDLQNDAKNFNVTQGKMKLINELASQYPELSKEFLAKSKLSDLIEWTEHGYTNSTKQEPALDDTVLSNDTSLSEPSVEIPFEPQNPIADNPFIHTESPSNTDIEVTAAEIQSTQAQINALHSNNHDGRNTEEILRLCDELEILYEALGEAYEIYYTKEYREYYRNLGDAYTSLGKGMGDAYEEWGESIGDTYEEWAENIGRSWRDYFD